MILILLHSFYVDSPKFSVMPNLIRHPENQLPESTAEGFTSCPALSGMTVQKKSIIIGLRYL
jgi:hypothetical protein